MHGYLSIEEINRQEAINKRRKIQFSLITFLVLFWTAVGLQPNFLALSSKFYHWGAFVMMVPTYVITFSVLSTLTGIAQRVVLSKIFKTCFSIIVLLAIIIYWVGVYHHYYTGIGSLCILFGIIITFFAFLLVSQIIEGDLSFPDLDRYFEYSKGIKHRHEIDVDSEMRDTSPFYSYRPTNIHYE
jgi:hypothetical protein